MKIKKMKNKFQEYKENKCSKKNLDSKQQTVSKRIIFGQQLEVCLYGRKNLTVLFFLIWDKRGEEKRIDSWLHT